MNIWVKQLTDSGSLFQYILSTRNRTLTNVTDDSIFYPNQVSCRPGRKEGTFEECSCKALSSTTSR